MSGIGEFSATAQRHLGSLFFQRVEQLRDRTFIKLQRIGRFEEISWKDFGSKVQAIVLGLYSSGLRKGERIAIVSENRLEWLCADMATLAGGLPNVVISPRLSDAMILRILGHSRARAVFVEDELGVGRILNLKGQLPSLDHIIVMESVSSHLPFALSFDELLLRGSQGTRDQLHRILESVHEDDLATIMYTSGSTGEPKGVMRTQKNILANIASGGEITLSKPDELVVLVLSMNHLLGRFGFHKSAATGRSTAVVEATELEVDLKSIQTLSPTSMTLVPRVMERIWAEILSEGENRPHWETLERLDQVKTERGLLSSDALKEYERLKALLRDAVRRSLGGRIKYVTYGGAPMAPRIMRFFELIGIPLLGSYGSTECGGVTLSGIGENQPGSLGKPFANIEVRIADDGEILVRGPTVTPGYFQNPEATREVLDSDAWFHTGDLGAIDPDGSLRIVGRKKDVFYCSDGSNIYPSAIELLLESDRLIRQAVLLGDHCPFIAALLVPEVESIAAALKREMSSLRPRELEEALWARVQRINERLEEYEKIRRIVIVQNDFPERVRSVTAFQKIKIDRNTVDELYKKEIEGIYARE
jgi:long-chain acyl-CoA synthetase